MDLYEQHKIILEMAVRQQGFHYRMPEGGQEAIDSGLVGESDPTWMYSDDRRASNGFTLTKTGIELVRAQGMVCQCALCGACGGREPALAVDQLCANCQTSAKSYGMKELLHLKYAELPDERCATQRQSRERPTPEATRSANSITQEYERELQPCRTSEFNRCLTAREGHTNPREDHMKYAEQK